MKVSISVNLVLWYMALGLHEVTSIVLLVAAERGTGPLVEHNVSMARHLATRDCRTRPRFRPSSPEVPKL